MARGKRIKIERRVKDPIVSRVNSIKISDMAKERTVVEDGLGSSVAKIVSVAQDLYREDKLEKDRLKSIGLFTIEEAYEELKKGGVNLSFRAFGGRVERKTVRSVKVGKKRLIPSPVIQDWVALAKDYYSVKEAYETLSKYERLNFRAFIGRIEKQSIPSIKIGTQRWVPKEAVNGLIHINKNYYDVGEAVEVLTKEGVRIKRNAFERRLDRNRIPHEKIGGRRVIAREVISELIQKERAISA